MKKISVLIFSLILLSLFVFSENPNPTEYEAKYYENAKVIRVKFTEGETYVKRSYDEGLEEAAINLPVFEKDTVGTTEGRLELYLGRINYLRLDYDTEIEFEKVPALRTTGLTVRINRGGIYLDIENLDYEKDIELQTPDCGIFLLDKGLYRVNVNEGGKTEVYVFDGTAEVAGDDYSRNIRANQKIVMLAGQVKERPFYFYSSDQDEFDSWNELRDKEVGYARYASSQYLENGYEDHEYELSRNGRWKYNDSYQTNIWIPYNLDSNWSPYYHGRWIWNPFYGYVWHSYDTWGWYTHYYGRWHWSYYDGWCWVPGYRWSPAWVSWYRHGGYYGWCPLSRYNRPIIVVNKRWLKNYNYKNGIPGNSSSLVVVKKNQLSASHIDKVALKKASLSKETLSFKGAAPTDRPEVTQVSVFNAKGNSVVYKQGGIFSTDKYKAVSSTSGTGKENVKGTVYKYNGKGIVNVNPTKYSHPEAAKAKVYRQQGTTEIKSKSYSTGETVTKSSPYKSDTRVSGKTVTRSGESITGAKTYKSDKASAAGYKSGTVSKKYSSPQTKTDTGSKSGAKISTRVYKKSSTSSKSSKSSSSTATKKVKKKKDTPYFSSGYNSSSTKSTAYPGSSYRSSVKKSYTSATQSYTAQRKAYISHHNSASIPRRNNSSYYNSTRYSSLKSYKPSSSYKNYSLPRGSSYSSPGRSSSYRNPSSISSYTKPSSSRSYSRPSSSSVRSSSARSSSGRSSAARSSSSGSSSRSVKKK